LVYTMFRVFNESLLYCSAASWLMTLVPFGPRNLLLLGADSFIQPLEITRMPHPALSFAVLLLAGLGTSESFARGGGVRLLCGGLACGLLFYSYYFSWVGFFLGLGVLFLITLAGRRFEVANRLVLIGLTAAVVSIPYWVRVFEAQHQASQADLL